ncbi:hypothetical protein JCGZ_07794 [Jatropha curcas]|uniref:BAH domain-containing protein n=1 Tax=Jatropha curcas TaxID=180498 RepID=A0A067KGX8_JATCU|nr:hypothetical protein JCGZ_07794 [Jatropha curcas]
MVQVNGEGSISFEWGKKRGLGGMKKDVQFYESFTYDGVEYKLYDSVYMYAEKEPEPYIGKLIKIWETSNKERKVKILWFFRPCEISNYIEVDKTLENELFLASGEGVGLANVNPLEAIAGKCNVVCISKDSRNPPPSNEQLQMADFIFYLTFDVEFHVISDKIDDKIAGVDVKFLLNRVNNQKSIADPKPDSNKKDLSGNAVVNDGAVVLSEENALGEHKTLKSDERSLNASAKQRLHCKDLSADHKSSLEQKLASSGGKDILEMVKSDHPQGNLSGDKSKSKLKEDAELVKSSVKQKSSLREKPTSDIGVQLGEVVKINVPRKNSASDKTCSRFNDKEIADQKPSLVKQKSSIAENCASNLGVGLGEVAKSNRQECLSSEKIASRVKDDHVRDESKEVPAVEVQVEETVKAAKDSGTGNERPSKKAKLEGSVKASGENNKKIDQKLNHDSSGIDVNTVDQTATTPEDKPKHKLVMDLHGNENIISKKPKLDEKLTKPSHGKLPKASPRDVSNDASKSNNQALEVTRRPDADKSKWFTVPPWEPSMRTAHAEGKLVLLQNLDPSCTAAEVEDIVWHAFKENCRAKVIQQTAFSSPYSGQALVIFKTREATRMVVRKLNEGCLLLSNGRKKLYLLLIVLSPTQLSMIWPWIGAYYKKEHS